MSASCLLTRSRALLCALLCAHASGARAEPTKEALDLVSAARRAAARHPLARARGFELAAERAGLDAALTLLDPTLSMSFDANSDLATIANPLAASSLTELTTARYALDARLTQPLRWGTALTAALTQTLVETNNPFRSCVPGVPSEQCYESRLTLSLTQPLLRGRSAEANTSSARAAAEAVEAKRAQARAEVTRLVEEAARSYSALSLALARLSAERGARALAARQLEEMQARVAAGLVAASELAALRLAEAQRARALLQAEVSAVSAREALAAALGEGAGEVAGEGADLSALTALPLPSWALGDLPAAALSPPPPLDEHPDLVALSALVSQAEEQLAPLRDQRLPQLNASLVWSQSGLGGELGEALGALPSNKSRFYGATVTLTSPLSDRAELQLTQALARLRALEAERDARRAALAREWAARAGERAFLEESLGWARRAEEAAREAWAAAEGRLEAGRGTRFEALERQEAAHQTALAALEATHALFAHRVSVMRLRGSLLEAFGVELLEGEPLSAEPPRAR